MVVLGTKPEYFNAVWVKNKWSQFEVQIWQQKYLVLSKLLVVLIMPKVNNKRNESSTIPDSFSTTDILEVKDSWTASLNNTA